MLGLIKKIRNAKSTIDKVVDGGIAIAKEAITDKDKFMEIKLQFEQLRTEAMKSARSMYEVELQNLNGPFINFVRAMVRPLWASVACGIWSFAAFTHVWAWWKPEITTLDLPWTIYAVIMQVVTFYFGGRMLEKRQQLQTENGTSLEKLGNLLK